MKILILGATGRTGKWLIRKALEKGFLVNVLVRDKSSLETLDRLNLFIGSPLDKELLAQAMTGCDAVISSYLMWHPI
jgi:putative NADH-flavin reductase